MKTFLILLGGFAWAALEGCQSTSETLLPNYDYEFSYTDVPDQQRLKLKFVSKTKRQICLGRDYWPSSGNLTTDSGSSVGAYLFVEGHIYAYKNTDFEAYCPTLSCYQPVSEGQTREAFLDYESFGLPEDSYRLPKTLKFKPQPFWCD